MKQSVIDKKRSDVSQIDRSVTAAFRVIRERCAFAEGTPEDEAMSTLEAFAWVALKVMEKSPAWRIREYSMTLETKFLLDAMPVVRPTAEAVEEVVA